jgi:hypothetical protein
MLPLRFANGPFGLQWPKRQASASGRPYSLTLLSPNAAVRGAPRFVVTRRSPRRSAEPASRNRKSRTRPICRARSLRLGENDLEDGAIGHVLELACPQAIAVDGSSGSSRRRSRRGSSQPWETHAQTLLQRPPSSRDHLMSTSGSAATILNGLSGGGSRSPRCRELLTVNLTNPLLRGNQGRPRREQRPTSQPKH